MTWRHRGSRHERGYGYAWTKARARILARDGHLCRICRTNGKVTVATQVDHITPKAKGGTDHDDNLQALCPPCHDAKTARDEGRRVRRAIGPDGYPIER